MCLDTTVEQTAKFKEDHQSEDEITVWKVYNADTPLNRLQAPVVSNWSSYQTCLPSGIFLYKAGTVKSNRSHKKIGNDLMDVYYPGYHPVGLWEVHRGIHVFTDRQEAARFCP